MMCLIDYPKSTFLSSVLRTRVLCAFLCVSSFICTESIAYSVEADTLGDAQVPIAQTNSEFEYVIGNRPDPFVPFISEKSASSTVDMNEIIDNTGPLTGMQLFEPGQLTLVATLKKNSEDVAMVQDSTGKGYVLFKGTKIGRRGVVKAITPNNVIIEETAVTRAGKELTTQVVMTLKKEGEE